MSDRPDWLQPLLDRLRDTSASDFTRLPTPDGEGPRQSAVLVLFGEQEESGPDILMLQRAATMRNHAGQPAFPGGAVDPTDADTIACALREAEEEVGLDPASVEVITTLPTLWIPVSNFLVTPVVAWWRSPHLVGPADPAEVARVERLPIRDLVDPANRLRVRHPSGWIGPAFRIHDMLVWGFTAGVVSTLLELGGWAVEWPTDRVEELPTPGAAPVG
ncbi:CoA pyrophosphatase [Dactylosporangium maewongense]|uniref:CoA pyrophosphatase n=1 Tax=Dactylosporangium maewongense TaxID=634393 RepID=A0ABP4NYE8_9ACTN